MGTSSGTVVNCFLPAEPEIMRNPLVRNRAQLEALGWSSRESVDCRREREAASPAAFEQLVVDRIVRASAEAAFQQGREHVQRDQSDHQPDRTMHEHVGRWWLCGAVVLEL